MPPEKTGFSSFVSATYAVTLAGLAVLVALLALSVHGAAQEASRTVEGITAYLGVMPSAIIAQSSRGHSFETAHGGAPRRASSYHLIVALYDARMNQRIEDASVKARVSEVGLGGIEKELQPMNIAGTVTYGNHFDLRSSGLYRITITAERSGKATRFQFNYRR